ncbi:hypothetical protein EV356DRAFT_535831 [Viridothelium virens]|uniref:Deoxyribonuclease NucA/NucB domain-containing protein n=1 Tax=Viridothelium virens TaxID=1048519 RepID=A0A6A6H078_VIRVR|nr:hypothetical protein EV356DRAFT_535831 [Viridothelium virens]
MAANKAYTFDCSKPALVDICKCDCWAKYCVRGEIGTNAGMLTYNGGGGNSDNNRAVSGYTVPSGLAHPCKDNGAWAIGSDTTSIEEYPFAAFTQGGQGTCLRCASVAGQKSQGGTVTTQGMTANVDQASVTFTNYGGLGVDWCNGADNGHSSCQNDGKQFWFTGGQYVLDSRGTAY